MAVFLSFNEESFTNARIVHDGLITLQQLYILLLTGLYEAPLLHLTMNQWVWRSTIILT